MPTSSVSAPQATAATAPLKVLVIEDEAIVAEDISQRLRRMGYSVVGPVNAGEDGMLLAEQTRPDLVLMDIVLKGRMDGVETAEMISQHLAIPVVFLTAHGDPATFARAKSTVPRGYVLKPFSEADLHRTIEVALGQHREARRLDGARRRLADTLRSINEGIVATDGEGRVSFINQTAEAMLGRSMAETAGRPVDEVVRLLHVDRTEAVPSSVHEALRRQCPVSNPAPLRVRSTLGAESIVEESATPICGEQGQTMGGIVVLRVLADRQTGPVERTQLVAALRSRTNETAGLRSLLPVCAWCKRIHAEDGSWKTIEELLGQSLELRMTHGICPTCSSQIAETF